MSKKSRRAGGRGRHHRPLSDGVARQILDAQGEPGGVRFDPLLNKWAKPTVHVSEPKITLQDAVGEAIAWVSSDRHSSVDGMLKDTARGILGFCASDSAISRTNKTANGEGSREAFDSLRTVSPNGLSVPAAGALSDGALSLQKYSRWSPLRRKGLVMAGQALTDTLGGAGLELLQAMEPEIGS